MVRGPLVGSPRRVITDAEGWLFVAGQLRRLEKSLEYDGGGKDADIGTNSA
jgi:hypothetical protein